MKGDKNMKLDSIIAALQKYAPLALAEDYDNPGLLIGDRNREITGVLTTLDVDIRVAREALEKGANLIVSHHPIMFSPIQKITTDTPEGRLLHFLIQNGIAVYAAHTNLDATEGGLNDLIAGLLGLSDILPLHRYEAGGGIGRVGILPFHITLGEFTDRVKEIFSLPFVRFTGDTDRVVNRIALCSGGGGSLADDAIASGADVYITGDLKYNVVRNAAESGLAIIEVDHFSSECFAKRLLAEIITDAFDDALPVMMSACNTDIYSYKG